MIFRFQTRIRPSRGFVEPTPELELGPVHLRLTSLAALLDVVRERGLEGDVGERVDGRYRPGERGWLKVIAAWCCTAATAA